MYDKSSMALAAITEEQLLEWMENQDFPHDVIQSFKGKPASRLDDNLVSFDTFSPDNKMDGESIKALLATEKGSDCFKDLIPKLGVRLRIYKRIKSFYFNQTGAPLNQAE